MGRFFGFSVLLLSLQATSVFTQAAGFDVNEELEAPSRSPSINVKVDASFPDAEIFGIKLVNGRLTNVKLSVSNEETEPVSVQFVGGSLWTPEFDPNPRIVRNLTTKQYSVEIPAGEKESLPYSFMTNMHPQELRLNLAAVVSKGSSFYNLQAFNGTVAVVEPDSSMFDPQIIFLYLFLLACAGGVGYLFYNIWIVPYFPQKKKAKAPRTPAKKVDVIGDKPEDEASASTTGAKGYSEEWIPAHHLQRPEAKRVKSGASRPKSRQG